jgi:DNA-binding LytR/AlgR family response regulator
MDKTSYQKRALCMNVTICDDDRQDVRLLRNSIQSFDSDIQVHSFYSGESLLSAFESAHACDLVFLDVKMAGINGFETAQRLQELEHPPLIAFVTQSSQYVFRGYGIIWRYLMKPVDEDTIHRYLLEAQQELAPQTLVIHTVEGVQAINIKTILYLEIYQKHGAMHTADAVYHFNSSLTEQEQKLPPGMFYRPHHSYLVNLNKVKGVSPDHTRIIMRNGASIPLSRKKKEEFYNCLTKYHSGN